MGTKEGKVGNAFLAADILDGLLVLLEELVHKSSVAFLAAP